MAVTISGSGTIDVGGTSTSQGTVRLYEDTDNGTNYVELVAPASVASNVTLTMPTTTGTVATVAGSDTQVIFNDGGSAYGGDSGLTYNKTTNTLSTDIVVFSAGSASAPSITATGDTNTGVFFPAADTAAISTGGTERLRVDSGGNLGLGVTPPASFYTDARLLQLGAGAGLFGNINNTASLELGTNQFINAAASARTYLNTGAVGVYQQSSGRHRLLSAASGSAGAALTLTTVFEVDKDKTLALQGASSTTGTGIAFPATQSASTDANTLDDYEEGTWTPTLASGGTGITYTSQLGKYTKIGNLVTFNFILKMSAVTAAATQIKIGGLPFSIGSDSGAFVGYSSFNTNAGDFYYLTPTVGTQIAVYTIAAVSRLGNDAGITLTGYIQLVGFYYV